jgi:hypothetical protein
MDWKNHIGGIIQNILCLMGIVNMVVVRGEENELKNQNLILRLLHF